MITYDLVCCSPLQQITYRIMAQENKKQVYCVESQMQRSIPNSRLLQSCRYRSVSYSEMELKNENIREEKPTAMALQAGRAGDWRKTLLDSLRGELMKQPSLNHTPDNIIPSLCRIHTLFHIVDSVPHNRLR